MLATSTLCIVSMVFLLKCRSLHFFRKCSRPAGYEGEGCMSPSTPAERNNTVPSLLSLESPTLKFFTHHIRPMDF